MRDDGISKGTECVQPKVNGSSTNRGGVDEMMKQSLIHIVKISNIAFIQ